MTYEQAIQELKKGKKVRRPGWAIGWAIGVDKKGQLMEGDKDGEMACYLEEADRKAKDWELTT